MTLFNAWKKEDQDAQLIRLQARCLIALFLICALLCMGWMSAPSRLRIYIPPDISNGATIKPNAISHPFIYSFAYEVWQELNYWPDNGSDNYPKNLRTYTAYLTPNFQTELRQEYQDLNVAGQIQRQRFMQGIAGSAYDALNVKQLNSDTWQVNLTMRLREYKNNQLVKDIDILYPLKIARRDIANSVNPYGLVIAGFVSKPVRLKTYI